MGAGATVVAVLPRKSPPRIHVDKTVLFYYEKGAELYGGRKSPALRIGFTPFHYRHGTDPTCEELTMEQRACKGCSKCVEAFAMQKEVNPMPLSADGLKILDAAIEMLDEEARKSILHRSSAAILNI